MGARQRDVLRDGREQVPEHPDPEGRVAVHHIFDPVGMLAELQADVPNRVVVAGEPYPLLHPADEACAQGILVGGAQVQVGHIGAEVRFPLGVEGVRIDAGADVVQLHLGRVADVHAVDLHGSVQEQERHQRDGRQDDEEREEGHVPAFVPYGLLVHAAPSYFQ